MGEIHLSEKQNRIHRERASVSPGKPTELGNVLVESPPCAHTMGGLVIHPHFLSRICKPATKKGLANVKPKKRIESNQWNPRA